MMMTACVTAAIGAQPTTWRRPKQTVLPKTANTAGSEFSVGLCWGWGLWECLSWDGEAMGGCGWRCWGHGISLYKVRAASIGRMCIYSFFMALYVSLVVVASAHVRARNAGQKSAPSF